MKKRADEISEAMKNEDGVAGAVKAFYKHFPRHMLEAKPESLHTPTKHFSIRRCFGCSKFSG